MIGVCRGLALDAAVPIEVTSSAALGRDTDLIGAGRVGAGLGRPVAARTLEVTVTDKVVNAMFRYRFDCFDS